jgi:predicted DNA-binding antitoxin AbrB/MazE fold protein
VRPVEAQYQDGILRPSEPLSLRPGERVNLIVVRRPDLSRWDLPKLAMTSGDEDLSLAEQGLAEWDAGLDSSEHD